MMATALTEASPGILSRKKALWHRSAPRQVVKRCPAGDVGRGWTAWQAHLARRKRLALPPFQDGRAQLLLDRNSAEAKGLMDINAEVYLK